VSNKRSSQIGGSCRCEPFPNCPNRKESNAAYDITPIRVPGLPFFGYLPANVVHNCTVTSPMPPKPQPSMHADTTDSYPANDETTKNSKPTSLSSGENITVRLPRSKNQSQAQAMSDIRMRSRSRREGCDAPRELGGSGRRNRLLGLSWPKDLGRE